MESRLYNQRQVQVSVQTWVELHKQCESAPSSAWQRITDAVNHEPGVSKTKSQVKRKIQNLKQRYKRGG